MTQFMYGLYMNDASDILMKKFISFDAKITGCTIQDEMLNGIPLLLTVHSMYIYYFILKSTDYHSLSFNRENN